MRAAATVAALRAIAVKAKESDRPSVPSSKRNRTRTTRCAISTPFTQMLDSEESHIIFAATLADTIELIEEGFPRLLLPARAVLTTQAAAALDVLNVLRVCRH